MPITLLTAGAALAPPSNRSATWKVVYASRSEAPYEWPRTPLAAPPPIRSWHGTTAAALREPPPGLAQSVAPLGAQSAASVPRFLWQVCKPLPLEVSLRQLSRAMTCETSL